MEGGSHSATRSKENTCGSLVGSWLCLLQFMKKCHENEYFDVKMFSRPCVYFLKETRGR